MNNPQALKLADAFAQRIGKFQGEPLERLTHAYMLAFSRSPTENELAAIRAFWMRFPETVQTRASKYSAEGKKEAQGLALSAFCQSLFASAEFRLLN